MLTKSRLPNESRYCVAHPFCRRSAREEVFLMFRDQVDLFLNVVFRHGAASSAYVRLARSKAQKRPGPQVNERSSEKGNRYRTEEALGGAE